MVGWGWGNETNHDSGGESFFIHFPPLPHMLLAPADQTNPSGLHQSQQQQGEMEGNALPSSGGIQLANQFMVGEEEETTGTGFLTFLFLITA